MAHLLSGGLSRLVAVVALLTGAALGVTEDPCPETTGLRQSPIDLNLCADTRQPAQEPLKVSNFDQTPATMTLTNTGKQVFADITWAVGSRQLPQISGGQLPGVFVPLGFILHWGANLTSGSEHSVNGRFFPAELYLLCRNILYTSNEEAHQNIDGLAGITVFFEHRDLKIFRRRGLAMLAPELASIRNASSSVRVAAPPSLRSLLPWSLQRFVTYRGSATALPPCPESVTWVSLLTPVPVLAIELQQLRQLEDAEGRPLESSVRRPQFPLNGRTLYTKGVTPICV
ncbi:putative carbonic anhydrase 3 [Amphibalanus amphitrite]|uniref:putative carbonic anhydrase 3 n=1 Tax=Amphibalanus amphitrite TaxID=1232801 RepID=UPI001C928788|nr:putative carbonic anhydrase 3 [Amphibalanus amphitrite]